MTLYPQLILDALVHVRYPEQEKTLYRQEWCRIISASMEIK